MPGRCAVRAALLCLLAIAPAAAAPDLGERLRACTACHGEDAIRIEEGYIPRIQGKPAGYLFNQLVNYREARRHNPAMNHLVHYLSDTYLSEIAGYFAARTVPYPEPAPAPGNQALLERGEQLVRAGDPEAGIPSCQSCHGERLAGVLPATPGLIGLPRHYIMGQLGAWRVGRREAASPDCMATIAQRLSAHDIGAVAGWLASRPLPEDTSPAPATTVDPPMSCGSVPRPEG